MDQEDFEQQFEKGAQPHPRTDTMSEEAAVARAHITSMGTKKSASDSIGVEEGLSQGGSDAIVFAKSSLNEAQLDAIKKQALKDEDNEREEEAGKKRRASIKAHHEKLMEDAQNAGASIQAGSSNTEEEPQSGGPANNLTYNRPGRRLGKIVVIDHGDYYTIKYPKAKTQDQQKEIQKKLTKVMREVLLDASINKEWQGKLYAYDSGRFFFSRGKLSSEMTNLMKSVKADQLDKMGPKMKPIEQKTEEYDEKRKHDKNTPPPSFSKKEEQLYEIYKRVSGLTPADSLMEEREPWRKWNPFSGELKDFENFLQKAQAVVWDDPKKNIKTWYFTERRTKLSS